jgi:hypothetical protein
VRLIVSIAVFVFLSLAALAAEPAGRTVFQETFARGLGAEWKPVKFSGVTEYKVVTEGTNHFVQARANKTASGLAREVKVKSAKNLKIEWRWKIDRCPAGGTETNITTFDHTARIFVAFDTFIGPARTVNYVWSNQDRVGGTFHHPNSDRARFVTLQSGNGKAGQWITEARDLTADWRRLFGKDEVPTVVGIGFMTDADGTQTDITGGYGTIRIFEE